MAIYKESFFRVFRAELRDVLQRFFENRRTRVTHEIACELTDPATLDKLIGLELIEHDTEAGEYRLDDRLERFFSEMLGTNEVARADWLLGSLEEMRRLIEGQHKLIAPARTEALLHRLCRLLRTCHGRSRRHLEDIKAAADYDYRAGSDYEVKLMNLQWHLDRARSYGDAVVDLAHLLRHDAFFQVHQEIELLAWRSRLLRQCGQVGDALIDIYQRIEEYLNRTQRDYARARKLIRLRGLIERHEHLVSTNLEEIAMGATGPWFRDLRLRTSLDPSFLDGNPGALERVLRKVGASTSGSKERRVEIQEHPLADLPPVVDWGDVYEAFCRQPDDLFIFLGKVRVEGRELTEEERVDGFCAILSNEDWASQWEDGHFETAADTRWIYAVVQPPLTPQP